MIVAAGVCVLLLGAASTSRRAQRSADRTARLFSAETPTTGPAVIGAP
jgi:hypothetical protein